MNGALSPHGDVAMRAMRSIRVSLTTKIYPSQYYPGKGRELAWGVDLESSVLRIRKAWFDSTKSSLVRGRFNVATRSLCKNSHDLFPWVLERRLLRLDDPA
jgi:hypothetical protein